MKKNMGSMDRVIRPLLAVGFFTLYFTGAITGVFAIILFVLAIILLLTSFVSYCPLYSVIGVRTLPKEKESAAHP